MNWYVLYETEVEKKAEQLTSFGIECYCLSTSSVTSVKKSGSATFNSYVLFNCRCGPKFSFLQSLGVQRLVFCRKFSLS
jgi:hypothetical protein